MSHAQRARRGGAPMRLRGLVRKEFLQVVRDPSALAIAFVLPLVLLLLFGYGVTLDAEHVPLAVVVDQPTSDTMSFCSAMDSTKYIDVRYVHGMAAARERLLRREVNGIVYVPEDFSEKLRSGRSAPVQVIVNGVDANTARLVTGYVEGAFAKWLERYAAEKGLAFAFPVDLRSRVWFNENVRSRNYLVPGIVALVMTLIGALLTALLVAREWERGTMEALMVTPLSMSEVLIGKILPYFILGLGGWAVSVGMSVWQFDVPLRGSLGVLFAASCLFLITALGMGLLISTVARIQFVAAQVAIIATFLPAFILSGFIFDIGSMPRPIQWVTHLIPARYYVAILKTSFLSGDVWEVIAPNMAALALMATFFLGATWKLSRKRLD